MRIPIAIAVAFASSPLAAQQKLDGRSFIPPEPKCEVWVDFAAMRQSGVWDGVSRSLVTSLLAPAEAQLGFRFESLDRFRGYPPVGTQAAGKNNTGIMVFEGNETVVAPDGRQGTRNEKIGAFEVVVEDQSWQPDDPDTWVSPRPGVVACGARHALEPVLLGKQQPGVLPAELLSLTAARGVLAHVVIDMVDEQGKQDLLQLLAVPAEVPAPQFFMLRMRQEKATGQDEPDVHLEGTLRWQDQGAGPEGMAAHLRGKIEELKKHPRLGALKRYWNKIAFVVDGRDLKASMPLGKPLEAGGMFATLAPLMMFTTSVRTEDVLAPAEAAPVPAPAPAPAPAGNGQQGGGNRGNGGG